MRSRRTERCDRLEEALVDGRFLEDPGLYRAHYMECERCKAPVEGMMILHGLIARARREAPVEDLDTGNAEEVVRAAVEAYRVYRLRRKAAIGLGVLAVLVGGGLLLAFRRPVDPPRDPVAYAEELHRAVFPRGEPARYDLLKQDLALREHYVAALGDPSSLVRRTAIQALTFSAVPLSKDGFEKILSHAKEDLETPLEVAGTGDGARWLLDALESRRITTLISVLSGLAVESATNGPAVPSEALLPFLDHRVTAVRQQALYALSFDASYAPGDVIERLMRSDPDTQVRERAAALLIDRGGEAGARTVVANLRQAADWPVEQALTPKFSDYPVTRDLSTQRVADPTTPTLVALAHARALWRFGVTAPPTQVIERALAEADPAAWASVAYLASGAKWTGYRDVLQEKWRLATGAPQQDLALLLTAWDEEAGEESRLLLSLEICEAHEGFQLLLPCVERLATSGIPAVRARAQVLLDAWPTK